MTKLEVILIALLLSLGGFAAGMLYSQANLDLARVQTIQQCEQRADILNSALDNLTKDKWAKWNFIYDATKKAEKR